jgi:hypothetical protein
MQPTDDQPKPEQLKDAPLQPGEKTTAPPTMRGMTHREAARLGIWSDGGRPGIRRRYAYSKT